MSAAREWLSERRPPAPESLVRWIDGVALEDGDPLEVLLAAGLDELDHARRAPGRIRESALHLLAADAFLTWACEAALEAPDPVAELTGILRKAATHER